MCHAVYAVQLEARLQLIHAPPDHVRGILKPLTQSGMLKTADWIGLSQMGYLLYLRMCHVPWQHAASSRPSLRAMFREHFYQAQAMAELTNYLDALLSPTLDQAQRTYILQQRNVAEWYFYKYMPREQHRLLAHALWHLAEQAVQYGPATLYWMFPMERSVSISNPASPLL